MKYIIISLKHGTGDSPMFWRASDAGYTYSPFAAGVYTEEQIKAKPSYYNNGESSIAVPLTDQAMSEIGFNCSFSVDNLLEFHKKHPIK